MHTFLIIYKGEGHMQTLFCKVYGGGHVHIDFLITFGGACTFASSCVENRGRWTSSVWTGAYSVDFYQRWLAYDNCRVRVVNGKEAYENKS